MIAAVLRFALATNFDLIQKLKYTCMCRTQIMEGDLRPKLHLMAGCLKTMSAAWLRMRSVLVENAPRIVASVAIAALAASIASTAALASVPHIMQLCDDVRIGFAIIVTAG